MSLKQKSGDKESVLFLPAWYPFPGDPMFGLFVQRHAEALARDVDIAVLFIRKEEQDRDTTFEISMDIESGVRVCRVTYSQPAAGRRLFGQVSGLVRYMRAFHIGLRTLKEEGFVPELTHVHVLTMTGFAAWYLKKLKGIPFMVTEHWSRYLPEVGGFDRKWIFRRIMRASSALTTPTRNLADAMDGHRLSCRLTQVVPNVVDTELFKPSVKPGDRLSHLVHISVFEDRSKNISGMLSALAELRKSRQDFRVSLVGEGMDLDKMKKISTELGLEGIVTFTGLLQGQELASLLADADLLLQFSNYENIPVVINEAIACAVPVLATRVGGIPEYLDDYAGRMVKSGDMESFLRELNSFLDGEWIIDPERMREMALREYAPEAVAARFTEIYRTILTR